MVGFQNLKMLVLRAQTELWEPPQHSYIRNQQYFRFETLWDAQGWPRGLRDNYTIFALFALRPVLRGPGWWTLCNRGGVRWLPPFPIWLIPWFREAQALSPIVGFHLNAVWRAWFRLGRRNPFLFISCPCTRIQSWRRSETTHQRAVAQPNPRPVTSAQQPRVGPTGSRVKSGRKNTNAFFVRFRTCRMHCIFFPYSAHMELHHKQIFNEKSCLSSEINSLEVEKVLRKWAQLVL